MAPSKFTPTTRGAILERIAAGCTHDEAARATEVSPATLRSWLRRGRREDEGDYSDFELKVREARAEADARPEPMDAAELKQRVSEMVRNGSVAAAKLLHEILEDERKAAGGEDEPADPLADLDHAPAPPAEVVNIDAARKRKGTPGK